MSNSTKAATAAAAFAGLVTAATMAKLVLPWCRDQYDARVRRKIRATLPHDLTTWRLLDHPKPVWEAVRHVFHDAGIYLWPYDGVVSAADTSRPTLSNGFAYITPVRGERWAIHLRLFNCHNELTIGGTTPDGLHAVLRVVVIGNEGKAHLEILRKLARGTRSLLTDNHVVPLWNEVQFEDIVFTVCPYVGYNMRGAYGEWAKNSVGDIVDMILQALEAIAFVHDLGITHRDLCKNNYLVQWHPESLSTMQVPLSRPRVFLTDFEMAHEFPPDVALSDRMLIGPPIEDYQRPLSPEVASGLPYDPFKNDIWQLAESFSDFKTTVPDIDIVLEQMFDPDSTTRLSAAEARDKLAAIVHRTPPVDLLIEPEVTLSEENLIVSL